MEHHSWSGRIDYVHDDRGERGREWFTVTFAPTYPGQSQRAKPLQ